MSNFEKVPKATDWTTVNKDDLDRLIKVRSEVRRVVITARENISFHMKQFPECKPDTCGIIKNKKVVAFDAIGEILKGVSEDDN